MKKVLGVVLILILLSCFTGKLTTAFAQELNEDEVYLPVIMYHQIYPAGNNNYRVSPKTLDDDLAELTRQGYTTIFPSELVNFVEGKGQLPKKPVLITFDDGHFNNVFYGEEILKKYNAKAVINVVGSFTDFTEKTNEPNHPRFSYLTWEQIKDTDKNVFEIGNHTYNLHKQYPRFGMKMLSGESAKSYREQIDSDVQGLQNKLLEKANIKPIVFAYPFGEYNNRVESYLAESGFKIILNCKEKVNKIRKGQPLPLVLGRFNRGSKYSSEQFVRKLGKV